MYTRQLKESLNTIFGNLHSQAIHYEIQLYFMIYLFDTYYSRMFIYDLFLLSFY